MYSEVRELVNFLCRYLHGRVPRRPTGIFGAEMGNYLVSQFSSTWDIYNPENGESDRVVPVNCQEGSSNCFETGARVSGLNLQEILSFLPTNLRIYANPGHVYMRVNDGISVPIWIGDVNADDNYQPMPEYVVRAASRCAEKYANSNLGAVGQPFLPSKQPLPTNDSAVQEMVNGIFLPLGLEETIDVNSNLCHLQKKYPYQFVFKPASSQTYTGIEFAQTRFGSSKARPDLQTMLNIKQMSSLSLAASSSTSTASPSLDAPAYTFY